jgi:hypothetical protein
MSIRTSPRFGFDPTSKVGNAAAMHLTPWPARDERLSVLLAGLKANLCLTVCGEGTARGFAGYNGFCLVFYFHKISFIEVISSNIIMYKNQHYNVVYNLIFNFSFFIMSVNKLTCNLITDNDPILRYILPLRRRS